MLTDRRTVRQKDRKTERLFSLVIKTKFVPNVNSISERYSPTDRQKKRQIGRLILVIKTKSCSECQQHVRKIERQTDRQKDI